MPLSDFTREAASHWGDMAKDCGVPSDLIDAIKPNMLLGANSNKQPIPISLIERIALFLYASRNPNFLLNAMNENEQLSPQAKINNGAIILGEADIIEEELVPDFTNYPFIIITYLDDESYIMTEEASTVTLFIVKESSVISNITPGFKEAVYSLGGNLVAENTEDDTFGGIYTLNKTAEEIFENYKKGVGFNLTLELEEVQTLKESYETLLLIGATKQPSFDEFEYHFNFLNPLTSDEITFSANYSNVYPKYPTGLPFTVNNVTYYHAPDDTWATWIESDYNIDGFSLSGTQVVDQYNRAVTTDDGQQTQTNNQPIVTNAHYISGNEE